MWKLNRRLRGRALVLGGGVSQLGYLKGSAPWVGSFSSGRALVLGYLKGSVCFCGYSQTAVSEEAGSGRVIAGCLSVPWVGEGGEVPKRVSCRLRLLANGRPGRGRIWARNRRLLVRTLGLGGDL